MKIQAKDSTTSDLDKNDPVISVKDVSKAYRIWRDPASRLKAPLLDALGACVPDSLRPKALQKRITHQSKSKYYTDFFALQNISLEIGRGESVGIVGRNGSGKSTLLQIICRTLTPTTGSITSVGRIGALLELGSGFNPEFTGRENVFLNGAILGLKTAQIDARFHEIEAFADIGSFIDQPVKTYSSGMMMRLAFSVQIAIEPDILIVDEALGVGDEVFQSKCYGRLEQLRESGTTLLFVSHDAATITSICSRAILLNHGRILKDGSPKAVINAYHSLIYDTNGSADTSQFPQEDRCKESGNAETIVKPLPDEETTPNTIQAIDESYFDPTLDSNEQITYKSSGCVIEKVVILNEKDETVNNLTHGCTYRVRVTVNFFETCHRVFFGSMISTIKGVYLAGYNYPKATEPIPEVPKGTKYCWEYRFTCNFVSGSFTVEVGICGLVNQDPHAFLHRKVDAAIFKILPIKNTAYSGLISLNQRSQLS